MLSLLVVATLAQSTGCTKDTDCKGERICTAGVCVDPPPSASKSAPPLPSPPPPPPSGPAPTYPNVTHRSGEVCVQTQRADGTIAEECVPERPPVTPVSSVPKRAAEPEPPPPDASPAPPPSPLVGDLAALVTAAIPTTKGSSALGGIALHGQFGARFADGVGAVALLNASFYFPNNSSTQMVTVGAGVRLGDDGHFTIGLGPTYVGTQVSTDVTVLGRTTHISGSSSTVMATFLGQGSMPISGAFGFHAQLGISVGDGGAIFQFAVGVGGSLF